MGVPMDVRKAGSLEENRTAADYEAHIAEDTEDVGPGQHLFGEPLEMYLLREPRLAVAFSAAAIRRFCWRRRSSLAAKCVPTW